MQNFISEGFFVLCVELTSMKTETTRRATLTGLATAGIASLAGCMDSFSSSDGGNLTMGGSPQGSIVFTTGQGLQRMTQEHSDNVSVTVQTTGGDAASFRLYDEGEVDFTAGSNMLLMGAHEGDPPFDDEPVDDVPYQGFQLTSIHGYMMAREGSGIETYDDLRGKNVWPLRPGFSTQQPLKKVLEGFGIWDEMNIVEMSQDDVPGALQEEDIDAIGAYGAGFNQLAGWLKQVDARNDLHVITMSESQKETIREYNVPDYEEIEPYGWDQDIGMEERGMSKLPSYVMRLQLVFGSNIPKDIMYELTDLARQNYEMIQESAPSFASFDDVSAMAAPILSQYPVHPGVAEVFKEQGIWDDSWTEGTVE